MMQVWTRVQVGVRVWTRVRAWAWAQARAQAQDRGADGTPIAQGAHSRGAGTSASPLSDHLNTERLLFVCLFFNKKLKPVKSELSAPGGVSVSQARGKATSPPPLSLPHADQQKDDCKFLSMQTVVNFKGRKRLDCCCLIRSECTLSKPAQKLGFIIRGNAF